MIHVFCVGFVHKKMSHRQTISSHFYVRSELVRSLAENF